MYEFKKQFKTQVSGLKEQVYEKGLHKRIDLLYNRTSIYHNSDDSW